MNKRAQVFSVDALLSFVIFLVILVLVFFIWQYNLNQISETEKKSEITTLTYFLTKNIVFSHVNSSISSLLDINDSICTQYGMYAKDLHCTFRFELENGSNYDVSYFNTSKKHTITLQRIIFIENQTALLTLGVQYD